MQPYIPGLPRFTRETFNRQSRSSALHRAALRLVPKPIAGLQEGSVSRPADSPAEPTTLLLCPSDAVTRDARNFHFSRPSRVCYNTPDAVPTVRQLECG